jgi:hypothetical protein
MEPLVSVTIIVCIAVAAIYSFIEEVDNDQVS